MAGTGDTVLQRSHTLAKANKLSVIGKKIRRHWQLYLIIILPLLYLIIFKYIPMFGAQIAFKDYNVVKGILGSPWAGMKHFNQFFQSPNFPVLLKNTLFLNLYSLLFGFPAPILLALALNELRQGAFKRTVQMVTYAPYFISTVVMVSMIIIFLSPRIGFAGTLLKAFDMGSVNILGVPELFRHIYVWSDIWQNTGYGAIIYMAALAGINPQLYEAAKVDGASRLQKIMNIDIPGIMPAAVILLILNVGQIMNVGFEKVFLLQNPLNTGASEVISTYVYKIGLIGANFSFSAAIGLFNSVINLILLLMVNYIARKISETSLW